METNCIFVASNFVVIHKFWEKMGTFLSHSVVFTSRRVTECEIESGVVQVVQMRRSPRRAGLKELRSSALYWSLCWWRRSMIGAKSDSFEDFRARSNMNTSLLLYAQVKCNRCPSETCLSEISAKWNTVLSSVFSFLACNQYKKLSYSRAMRNAQCAAGNTERPIDAVYTVS